MERPKHRWFLLAGLVLGVGLLLVARPWVSTTSEPAAGPASVATPHSAEPDEIETAAERAAPAAATPTANAPPTAAAQAESGTFRGRIIDAVTRGPVSEFEVRLERVQRGQVRQSEAPVTQTFQSKTGRFAWKQAPAGEWNVTVATRGYQPFKVEELRIDPGEATQELVLPLIRGFTLRGRVFDASSGIGIAEAGIGIQDPSVWPGRGPDAARYEKTKDDGSFVIEGVPGGDIQVIAFAKEHASRQFEVLMNEETLPVEIGLATGGSMSGFVVEASGKPVSGMISLSGPEPMGFIDKLDDTGAFSFKHRRAGRYSISAITSAGSPKQEIELAENEHRASIILTVAGGRTIRGVITGLAPERLKEAHVSAQPEAKRGYFSGRIDEEGNYSLGGVPPGRIRLSAHAGFSRQLIKMVDVPADKDIVIDIVFPPGARLSGRITQAGQPAPEKMIWMAPVGSQDSQYSARTKEDGRYEIEGLQAGEYRLRADEDVSRTITIAGDATLDIDIPSVQVGGRVIEDGTAVPIVGADVFFRGSEPATIRVRGHRETDHFGRFKLTGFEPGEVTLTVYKPGYDMHRERIPYVSPLPDRTIKLRRTSGIEIRVTRTGDGELPRGIELHEQVPGHEWDLLLWIPLDRDGVGSVPNALVGSTFSYYASSKWIVVKEWDGQPLHIRQ